MKAPRYSCPEIARTELWIEKKISVDDFREFENRMDVIRDINYDLRKYARIQRRKLKFFIIIISSLMIGLMALSYSFGMVKGKSDCTTNKVIPMAKFEGCIGGDMTRKHECIND